MKRALEIKQLLESFYDGFKDRFGEYTEIFKNPSPREIRDAADNPAKSVRFIADSKTKTVYIWNAYVGALHPEVLPRINKKWDWQKSTDILIGEAVLKGGKLVVEAFGRGEFMDPEDTKTIYNMDWKWLDRTILTTPSLENWKKNLR